MLKYFFYNIKEHNAIWFKAPIVKSSNRNILSLLWQSIKICIRSLNHKEGIKSDWNEILFVSISQNNSRVLAPIMDHLIDTSYSVIDTNDTELKPSVAYLYKHSCLYLLPFLFQYLKMNHEEKRICKARFEDFFFTFAYLCFADTVLSNGRVKVVVLANDHSSLTRAFIVRSHQFGIKTVYLQHCSVGYHFPSLEFSYSFLDGEESFLKYKAIGGISSIIMLSGNPRYDKLLEYRNARPNNGYIGIAINSFDSEEDLKNLCSNLQDLGFSKICVRPHPGHQLPDIGWFNNRNIMISDPQIENTYAFLEKLNVLIAGESGIHLEAALMGVLSICFIMSGEKTVDWYSYIKNKLIPYAENFDQLIYIIKNASQHIPNENKLRYYNASIGSSWYGNTAQLVAKFLESVITDSQSEFINSNFVATSVYDDITLYKYAN